MQDLGVRLPIYRRCRRFPRFKPTGSSTSATTSFASFPRHGVEINDRVNWAKGKHQIQFGGEANFQDVKIGTSSGARDTSRSTGGVTGHALSDFLLGQINTFDQGTGE